MHMAGRAYVECVRARGCVQRGASLFTQCRPRGARAGWGGELYLDKMTSRAGFCLEGQWQSSLNEEWLRHSAQATAAGTSYYPLHSRGGGQVLGGEGVRTLWGPPGKVPASRCFLPQVTRQFQNRTKLGLRALGF